MCYKLGELSMLNWTEQRVCRRREMKQSFRFCFRKVWMTDWRRCGSCELSRDFLPPSLSRNRDIMNAVLFWSEITKRTMLIAERLVNGDDSRYAHSWWWLETGGIWKIDIRILADLPIYLLFYFITFECDVNNAFCEWISCELFSSARVSCNFFVSSYLRISSRIWGLKNFHVPLRLFALPIPFASRILLCSAAFSVFNPLVFSAQPSSDQFRYFNVYSVSFHCSSLPLFTYFVNLSNIFHFAYHVLSLSPVPSTLC